MGRILAAVMLVVFLPLGVAGQSAFEVASIRVNRSRDRGSIEFPKGGQRFTATNMPPAAIVLVAYGVTVRQFSGSDPLLAERYDIAAKAEHPVRPEEMLRLLQVLLAERFHLVVRRETREVPVYALTVARGGPKLRRTALPDDAESAPRTPASAGGSEVRSGYLKFTGESMADFAWALSRTAATGDRVVVDRTGLAGRYDFELTFERDSAPEGTDLRPQGPSIFSAVQEQLGLKLESTKAAVEFLVVEHVERPAEN
jgi:uncharacterized protein (TIGR03435 family)